LDESEEWQGHFERDLDAFKARAKTLWAPQHRCSDITKVEKTKIDSAADNKDVATTDTANDVSMGTESVAQASNGNSSYIASVGAGLSQTIGLGRLMGYSSTSGADHDDITKKAEDSMTLSDNGEDLISKEQVNDLDKTVPENGEGVEGGGINPTEYEIDPQMKAQDSSQGSLGSRISGLMNWQRNGDGTSPNENVQSDQIVDRRRSLEGTAGRVQLPGVLVHLSFQHGQVEAFEVSDVETFPDLNEINLYFSALDDHKGGNYIEALETVRWQRAATQRPAEWKSFASSDSCYCCSSMFTWQSTSNSEAQKARDKHNCRGCGELVCDACSLTRKTLPSAGFLRPVRICDKCFMSGKAWL